MQATEHCSHAVSTAERILTTAHDLFYQHGIRAVGVDRLIAESGVAKRTFYRHYPTKDDLVLRFLDYRHERWMCWFTDALQRNGGTAAAIAPSLREWFASDTYRGCAFINAVVELGDSLPAAVDVSRRHKADVVEAIGNVLPRASKGLARVIAVAVEGAIVTVQFGEPVDEVVRNFSKLVAGMGPEAACRPTAKRKR